MKLSVLIPVYNEKRYLLVLLARVLLVSLEHAIRKEIVLVEDCSSDGTKEIVQKLQVSPVEMLIPYLQEQSELSAAECEALIRGCEFQILFQPVNKGKGAAIRRAIDASTGDIVLIQDADLEYNPKDYNRLLQPILIDDADVVYGSRFKGECTKVLYYRHTLGNKFLTFLSNLFTDLNFTDMETCYKVFKGPIIRRLYLTSDRFGFEPEVTARIAKARLHIFEAPISYNGRTYADGKKITWRDGLAALWFIVKFNLFSHKIYRDETTT